MKTILYILITLLVFGLIPFECEQLSARSYGRASFGYEKLILVCFYIYVFYKAVNIKE